MERTLRAARALPDTGLVVAHTPAEAGPELADWLGSDLTFEAQRGGDLGARMRRAIETRLEEGSARVVVIGTDAPDLTPAILQEAFTALGSADVVVGPAADGGYYLIGMRAAHRVLFDGIPWSTDQTLARTLAAARQAALRVHVLEILSDIDTADDWRRWARRQGRMPD